MQIRFVLALVVSIAAAVSLTACSNKSTPNEENFSAVVKQKLASSPQRCLPALSWPASSEPSDHGNPYGFYDAGVGFVDAGLATVKEAGPNASTNFRKKAIFSLTDEGKKILVREPFQPYPKQQTGRFCYGNIKLTKILKWDAPVTIGSATGTTVYYAYEITDAPKWAGNEQLRSAYPELASDMTGKGQATLPVVLSNEGWQAAN
ncbi:hypothetical protein [Paraburkholderia graminis]|uniref:Lipoprotein n=1 Tax=Paraburkholderia graminis TaxID=60548 RepID=A0ABD5CSW1_9BURK|nr:hypothetical protein [Paraburkholderia graminis]MDR6208143.1 hypothetical protein [Paraburkholderia graminis]